MIIPWKMKFRCCSSLHVTPIRNRTLVLSSITVREGVDETVILYNILRSRFLRRCRLEYSSNSRVSLTSFFCLRADFLFACRSEEEKQLNENHLNWPKWRWVERRKNTIDHCCIFWLDVVAISRTSNRKPTSSTYSIRQRATAPIWKYALRWFDTASMLLENTFVISFHWNLIKFNSSIFFAYAKIGIPTIGAKIWRRFMLYTDDDDRFLLPKQQSPIEWVFDQSRYTKTHEFMTSSWFHSSNNIHFSPCNLDDTPVIAQFASNLEHEYLSAAEMIYPYVDGIDLNCGCPQSWAMRSGYGCAMLRKPELISSLTSSIRRNLPGDFSVSVKVRIQKTLSWVS